LEEEKKKKNLIVKETKSKILKDFFIAIEENCDNKNSFENINNNNNNNSNSNNNKNTVEIGNNNDNNNNSLKNKYINKDVYSKEKETKVIQKLKQKFSNVES
jgi:trans-2-enoyl-CoA reductase